MNGSIPSWAVPGAKVVCVDDKPIGVRVNPCPPLATTLVVSGVISDNVWGNGPSLLIEGYPNPSKVFSGNEMGWRVARFRPLITKSLEQDSTMFRKLLQPKRVRRSVDA